MATRDADAVLAANSSWSLRPGECAAHSALVSRRPYIIYMPRNIYLGPDCQECPGIRYILIRAALPLWLSCCR